MAVVAELRRLHRVDLRQLFWDTTFTRRAFSPSITVEVTAKIGLVRNEQGATS